MMVGLVMRNPGSSSNEQTTGEKPGGGECFAFFHPKTALRAKLPDFFAIETFTQTIFALLFRFFLW